MNHPITQEEHNKAMARRVNDELWGKGNMSIVDELCSANYIQHQLSNPNGSRIFRGPNGFKQLVREVRAALSDFRTKIDDQMAAGDKVVTRWSSGGLHKGPLLGIAPTGKPITYSGVNIDRIADGKLVETWTYWDILGVMQQLGVQAFPEQVEKEAA